MDSYKAWRKQFLAISLVLLLVAAAIGQAPGQASPSQTATQGTQQTTGQNARPPQSNESAPAPKAGQDVPAQEPPETKISPKDAEELFKSVDEILKFASQETALPIHKPVKRRLTSRDEVTAYLEKHLAEDEDAQRLKRSEAVLKKFGLLPRDFDLGKFLVALLREQVAGYYDPKTKTVNLLDWLDAEQQRPVLAHELTHALQDQSFGLEKWMKAGTSDLALKKKDATSEDIDKDEEQTARQAIVEGQAMAVLIDYMLAPTGQSLTTSPQIVEALKQGMLVGTADSVEFRNAPIFLKEILTFPYRYGLDFVGEVLVKNGKSKAYAGVFSNPPRSTRQIMEPATYLAGEQIEPMHVPELSKLTKDYEKFDVGSMGEFDVALLLDQYEGVDASKPIYSQWRGGYYYAARPKGNAAGPLALLYVSKWSSPEIAARFASIYANSLKKRYRTSREVPFDGHQPLPQADTSHGVRGGHEWLTEEGGVVIDQEGDTVFISESFDDATSAKLREAILQASHQLAASVK